MYLRSLVHLSLAELAVLALLLHLLLVVLTPSGDYLQFARGGCGDEGDPYRTGVHRHADRRGVADISVVAVRCGISRVIIFLCVHLGAVGCQAAHEVPQRRTFPDLLVLTARGSEQLGDEGLNQVLAEVVLLTNGLVHSGFLSPQTSPADDLT